VQTVKAYSGVEIHSF